MEGVTKRKLSYKRAGWSLASLLLSVAAAYFFREKYHNNSNALTILSTVFSILAGFLIAVFAIVSDERALRGKSWRSNVADLELIKRELRSHRRLFFLYLMVLTLAFIVSLDFAWPMKLQIWIEYVLVFLASIAMISSFRLPSYLMNRHMDALDRVIAAKREEQTRVEDEPIDRSETRREYLGENRSEPG